MHADKDKDKDKDKWDDVCQLKTTLLSHCGWGNFRKHLRLRKLITYNDMAPGELKRYSDALGIDETDALDRVNYAIGHEINLLGLVTRYFGEMGTCLLTRTHSKSIALHYAYHLWKKKPLNILFPNGYQYIEYLPGSSKVPIVSGDPSSNCMIILRKSKNDSHHMMGAYKLRDMWYFIDSNADNMDQELACLFKDKAISYPVHAVNSSIHGIGHCTVWTIFFIQLLKSVGPMDYTHIPTYVWVTLFTNYCAHISDIIN